MPRDGGNLILDLDEATRMVDAQPSASVFLRGFVGSQEIIHVRNRKCLWIEDKQLDAAQAIPEVWERIKAVESFRLSSTAKTTRGYAAIAHKFAQRAHQDTRAIAVAATSSETRPYLPADLFDTDTVISNLAFALYRSSLWELAIVISKLHIVWVATVCGKLETRLRYASTLGWNTFPLPALSAKNKADLTRSAEDILLAREHHFPATIADLYDPESMPEDLRQAHERNDEVLERVYIGRRFRNDTERLERLFDLYAKARPSQPPAATEGKKAKPSKKAKTGARP
jgi:hypothetical protein